MSTQQINNIKQQWQNFFGDSVAKNWLLPIRQQHLESFLKQGFPSIKDEHWKYTNLDQFNLKDYLSLSATKPLPIRQGVDAFLLADHYRLVFINGFYHAECSTVEKKSDIIITSLTDAIIQYGHLLEKYLENYRTKNVFSNFNTACMQDGSFIFIPTNCQLDRPLQLLYISTQADAAMQNSRNLIIAQPNARVEVIEQHVSLDSAAYSANLITQLHAEDNAYIGYTKIQQQNLQSLHIANLEFSLQKDSVIRASHHSLGARLAREDISCYLNGAGGNFSLQGLYFPLEMQHMDIQSHIFHSAHHTHSEEFYKGIVGKKSRGVFNGSIRVEQNIKQVVANLQNRNLLLSPDSEVNTKPVLEIYTDDVKCRHGATVGQLDSQMLFYLQSRGISQKEARQILLLGFVNEILEKTPNQQVASQIRNVIETLCYE